MIMLEDASREHSHVLVNLRGMPLNHGVIKATEVLVCRDKARIPIAIIPDTKGRVQCKQVCHGRRSTDFNHLQILKLKVLITSNMECTDHLRKRPRANSPLERSAQKTDQLVSHTTSVREMKVKISGERWWDCIKNSLGPALVSLTAIFVATIVTVANNKDVSVKVYHSTW
jgi:hypothetical protein